MCSQGSLPPQWLSYAFTNIYTWSSEARKERLTLICRCYSKGSTFVLSYLSTQSVSFLSQGSESATDEECHSLPSSASFPTSLAANLLSFTPASANVAAATNFERHNQFVPPLLVTNRRRHLLVLGQLLLVCIYGPLLQLPIAFTWRKERWRSGESALYGSANDRETAKDPQIRPQIVYSFMFKS